VVRVHTSGGKGSERFDDGMEEQLVPLMNTQRLKAEPLSPLRRKLHFRSISLYTDFQKTHFVHEALMSFCEEFPPQK